MKHHAIAAICLALCTLISAAQNSIIYVDATAAGVNNGSSWGDAFKDLQDALAVAQSGDQIWVALGTYRPGSPDAPLTATFNLVSGVAMYGGFAGWEQTLDQRDWIINETVLSGDLIGDGSRRVYNVMTGLHLIVGSIVDGFTIRDGFAWDDHGFKQPSTQGAGLWLSNSALEIANVVFRNNSAMFEGGGIRAADSVLILVNTTLHNNFSSSGGAIRVNDSYLEMTDVIVKENAALTSSDGGGLYSQGSTVVAHDCEFIANTAGGGGAILASGDVFIEGCTFTNNLVTFSGSAISWSGNLTIRNSMFDDNGSDGMTLQGGPNLQVNNSVFRNTNTIGGAISLAPVGVVTVVESAFIDHYRELFGAGGMDIEAGGTVEIINCLFENHRGVHGGAIRTFSPMLIANTKITENLAVDQGGAAVRSGANKLTLINCEITDNVGGGAVEAGNLTMINTLVTRNWHAGVLIPANSTAEIIHSTIAFNRLVFVDAHAGLMVDDTSNAVVRNSIIWGNGPISGTCDGSCAGPAFGCWCDEGCCVFRDCCPDKFEVCGGCEPDPYTDGEIESHQIKGPVDVQFSAIHGFAPGSPFVTPGSGNIGNDPLFVKPAGFAGQFGDYRLQSGSPAIDAGSNRFVPKDITTDLDGNPRIVDGIGDGVAIVDMGAYEFQPAEVEEPCAFADLNCDGVVNHLDLVILVHSFGPCPDHAGDAGLTQAGSPDCPADLNGDGVVNAKDLLLLLSAWYPAAG